MPTSDSTPSRASYDSIATTRVEWLPIQLPEAGVTAKAARFRGLGGVEDWHLTVELTHPCKRALTMLEQAWRHMLEQLGLPPASTLMRRIMCDDMQRLEDDVESTETWPGGCSRVGQAPLSGGPLALWSQHLVDPKGPLNTSGKGGHFCCDRSGMEHHWFSGLSDKSHPKAAEQAKSILKTHDQYLAEHKLTLARNTVRTWWHVRDIDADYQGLVESRRAHFKQHGLTSETHYIASTGIGGTPAASEALLSLDSYAIGGLRSEQITHLNALNHLGPTHQYGVTFERATAIDYADRRHILISGTASIDPEGNIVHPGSPLKQLDRTLENIEALLSSGGGDFSDMTVILVYLRNPEDGNAIRDALQARWPLLPMLILHAPVCRPGWLVEIEGVAVIKKDLPELPAY